MSLACSLDGERPAILHYGMMPKAWHGAAWRRVRRDAYVLLFGRVTCGSDVWLRMAPRELPLFLRPRMSGRMALAVLDLTHGAIGSIRRVMRRIRTSAR